MTEKKPELAWSRDELNEVISSIPSTFSIRPYFGPAPTA